MAARKRTLCSALKKISKNHLECSICQERYTQPKILECLHSFCEQCLNTYHLSKYNGKPTIPCPVCRQETVLPKAGVSGLKTNFYITSLKEEIALQEQVAKAAVTCDICGGDKEATHRCLDNSKNICGDCLVAHKKFPDLSKHTVASLEDVRQGRVEAKKAKLASRPECEKHPGEVKRFFCEKCEELICRDCTVVDHPTSAGHRFIDSSAASSKLRQSLTQYIPKLDKNTEALQQALQVTDELKNELKNNVAKSMKEVEDFAGKVRAQVKADEHRIKGDITKFETDRMQLLLSFEKDFKTLLQRSKHSLEMAKEITTSASDSDLLSLYREISKNLQAASASTPARTDNSLSSFQFQQNQRAAAISLGTLVHDQPRLSILQTQKSGFGTYSTGFGFGRTDDTRKTSQYS